MIGESDLATFQVEMIKQTLGDTARFELLDEIFGISDPERNTYVKYRLATRNSCAARYPNSPPHLVQLADIARTASAVKSTLEIVDEDCRILDDWESKPGRLIAAFIRRHARLMFELSWDKPFGVDESEQPAEGIVTQLDGLLLLSILSPSSFLLVYRRQLNATLIRPQGGKLSRIHSNTLQRNELAVQRVIAYYESAEARQDRPFLESVVSILRGELDFLRTFEIPAIVPDPPARAAGALSRQFTTSSDLSALLEESGRVWVGGSLVYVDTDRLDVLERLEAEFGTDSCYYARGVFDGPEGIDASGSNIDESYLILVTRRPTDSGYVEDAIAISSIAGRNATYYVRGDVSQEHWAKVLTGSKIRAQLGGARRLKFVANIDMDEYEAMHEKLSHLSSCDAADFANSNKSLRYSEMFGYVLL